jgi:UDP-2-acetamido-3-amino-2,3-dideoxy-glucuronate N-acetyltransferase
LAIRRTTLADDALRLDLEMPDKLNVAVIGTGYWGKNLLRNFDALNSLYAFCDADDASRSGHEPNYPAARSFKSYADVLADEAVDAVAIATPAATHGALVRQALDAGKNVFVEKPLCLDIEEAEALRDLALARQNTLMVGHLLLYHPAFRAVKEYVASGRLGGLRYIYSNRLSLGKIRKEENALWSFAPHDISMILSLSGKMPEKITATGGHFLHDGVADTTLSHLSFSENLQAHIFVSWLHPFKDHRMVVIGEKGMVAFNDAAQGEDKVLSYPHTLEWNGDIPNVSRAEAEPIPYGAEEPLRLECKAFLDAVKNGTTPPSSADEGVRVLKVLDACQRAITSGTSVQL